jgi:hypothetical protein
MIKYIKSRIKQLEHPKKVNAVNLLEVAKIVDNFIKDKHNNKDNIDEIRKLFKQTCSENSDIMKILEDIKNRS